MFPRFAFVLAPKSPVVGPASLRGPSTAPRATCVVRERPPACASRARGGRSEGASAGKDELGEGDEGSIRIIGMASTWHPSEFWPRRNCCNISQTLSHNRALKLAGPLDGWIAAGAGVT